MWHTQAVDQTATGLVSTRNGGGEGSRLPDKCVGEEGRCALGTSVLSLSSTWRGSVPFLISEQQWVQHVQIWGSRGVLINGGGCGVP